MTNSPKDNIANRTADKKHGALYKDDVPHVESQDKLEDIAKSSEEE